MPLSIPTPLGDISAAVWTYLPNRRLTNLADVRAALIDNLDVLLSSRESEVNALARYTALLAAVGAIPTNPELATDPRLNNLDATISSREPSTDPRLTNLDAPISGIASTLKPIIDAIIPALSLTKDAEGSVTADGTEQTVVDKVSTSPFKAQAIVNLSNLAGGDSVVLKEYTKTSSGGALGLVTSTTFTGPQGEPIAIFLLKNAIYEYKVTLQQTLGTYRNFAYVHLVGVT